MQIAINAVCVDIYDVPLGEKDQAFRLFAPRYFLRVVEGFVKSNILFYFVSPSDEKYDENKLMELRKSNPEYYEGLLNGWSVLFLGATNEAITHPELISLRDILLQIPEDFWNRYSKHQLILNDEIVTEEYVERLRGE